MLQSSLANRGFGQTVWKLKFRMEKGSAGCSVCERAHCLTFHHKHAIPQRGYHG